MNWGVNLDSANPKGQVEYAIGVDARDITHQIVTHQRIDMGIS